LFKLGRKGWAYPELPEYAATQVPLLAEFVEKVGARIGCNSNETLFGIVTLTRCDREPAYEAI
jgi:hypothetical protein